VGPAPAETLKFPEGLQLLQSIMQMVLMANPNSSMVGSPISHSLFPSIERLDQEALEAFF
jgi:hypothetical protein